MTQYEFEVSNSIARNVPKISKSLATIAVELKKANQLKALELKAKRYGSFGSIPIEIVDNIIDGKTAN